MIMKNNFWASIFFIVFGIYCLPLSAQGNTDSSSSNREQIHLQLKWTHQFQFAGYYAALEKGFYKDVELDVIIDEGGPGIEVAERVKSGAANFGVLASELVWKRSQGEPFVVLAPIIQHSIRAVIVRNDRGIVSPADLVGKKLMLTQAEYAEILSMFKNEGIQKEKLTILEVTKDGNDMLLKGEIDGINGSIANQPYTFMQKGVKVNSIRPVNYGVDFYGDCLFTTEKEIKDHPNRVEDFRQASLKGWEYALNHREEIIDLIVNKYKSTNSREHLKFEADTLHQLILPDLVQIGHMNPGRWERIVETYIDFGFIDPGFSLEGFIYSPRSKPLYKQFFWLFALLLSIAFLAGISILVLWTFNRKLKQAVQHKTLDLLDEIDLRKQQQQSLRESEEQLAFVLEGGQLGFWDLNLETNEVKRNERWAEILGYKLDEIDFTVNQWLDFIHPDDRSRAYKSIQDHLEGRSPLHSIEYRMLTKDGHFRWIFDQAQIVKRDSDGRPLRMCGTHTDVTQRKQTEVLLLESQKTNAFLADMLQSSSQPFAAGYADGRLLLVNSAYCALVGYSEEELRTKNSSSELTPPEWHAVEARAMAQLIATKQPVSYEKEYIAKDGLRIPVELLTHIRPSQTYEPDIFYAFITDLTERKRQEKERKELGEQLFQAQKMESVGRLAGGVAHDFNNMLGVILGHTEMVLEEVDPAAALYESLHAVKDAAERSAALTRQLLAFARKQTVVPKVIDINDTVEGMLKMLRRLIGEDLDLLWKPGKHLRPVKIDPSQIDQILANLCVNARDAIAGEGKITIETDIKIFDEAYCADHLGYLPGEYVLLEVSDDGCGMDKKTLNQIFEPFFTTKEQGKGTGLGLASVFGMVKQNNGFINVYSEPDQGTTFKVYLPAYVENSGGVVEKAQDLPTEYGNETILLVEDESAILQMTTKMLTRLGYTVIGAATPGEAIRLAHEHRGRIDLLMTDVVMPEMNGRDLSAKLLFLYPNLKRLYMSGYTANVIVHHGVLDEGVHFIQKPFSKKDLGGKLREALEG